LNHLNSQLDLTNLTTTTHVFLHVSHSKPVSKRKVFQIKVVHESERSFTHRIRALAWYSILIKTYFWTFYTILYSAYWKVRNEESGWKYIYGIYTDIILNRNIFAFRLSGTSEHVMIKNNKYCIWKYDIHSGTHIRIIYIIK
jgi:hypothetical protein